VAIKAIVFDFFGVFYLNSHDVLIEHFPTFQNELEDLRRQSDYGMLDKNNYLQAIERVTGADQLVIQDIIMGEHRVNEALFAYAKSELKPHYKLGLLSNVGRGWMDNFLSQQRRHELFDAVVLSGDEGVTKPHPQIYELIAERLELEPEECLMIDDLPENAAGADAAGMPAIVYGNVRDLKIELKRELYARVA
jgi:putative hydrolase of the HAD superfamily